MTGLVDVTDHREKLTNQLLAQGYATMDQLLEASYGEWPPKGLEIIGTNQQIVNLISTWELNKRSAEKEGHGKYRTLLKNLCEISNTFGRASLQDERVIGLNTSFIGLVFLGRRTTMQSIMGHEAVHILQGDHYWRSESLFGAKAAQEILHNTSDSASYVIAQDLFKAENMDDRFLYPDDDGFWGGWSESDPIGEEYYRDGHEMQAHLHQILIEGYQRWETLPGNRAELLAAMKNSGLTLPDTVEAALRQSPDYENATKRFARDGSSLEEMDACKSLNKALIQLNDKGLAQFWDKTLPLLYSDLIEMYGDRLGRERFNLGTNPRCALRQSPEYARQQTVLATQIPPMKP